MEEEWRDVTDWEGFYQVSNFGRVRRIRTRNGLKKATPRILKPGYNKLGYATVVLSDTCKRIKSYFLHRLVAIAWIPNPNNLPQINHKDENPSNNCVENLEWCDAKYNMNYGTRIERLKKSLTNNPYTSKRVEQLDKQMNHVAYYESINEAVRKTGIHYTDISKCCCKKKWYKTAGGFIWRFVSQWEA